MDDDAIDRLARSLSPTLAAPRLETLRSAPPVDPERAADLAKWMERHGLTPDDAEAVCTRTLALHQAEIDESATAFGRDEWWPANRAILWVQERSLRAVAAAYARDGRAFSDLFGMDVDVLRAGGDLAAECRAAHVIAHGRPAGAGDVREISAAEWGAGLAFYTSNAGRLYLAYPPGAGPAFTDVVFDRRSLFAAFEPLAERIAIRPGEYVRMTFEPDARDMMFDDVLHGRKSPAEAEAEAAAKGLEPLHKRLDPARYDPEGETDWTQAMAVAWIAYRDLDRVRQCMPAWRRDFEEWAPVDRRLPDGTRVTGQELRHTLKGAAPLMRLGLTEAIDGASFAGKRMTIHDAKRALRAKLRSGELEALTPRGPIEARAWAFLTFGEHNDRDAIFKKEGYAVALFWLGDVLISRTALVAAFPADLPAAPAKAEPEAARARGRPAKIGDQAEAAIADLTREGRIDIAAIGEKKLARILKDECGIAISPRQAGRIADRIKRGA